MRHENTDIRNEMNGILDEIRAQRTNKQLMYSKLLNLVWFNYLTWYEAAWLWFNCGAYR